jgi:hypothetical protein
MKTTLLKKTIQDSVGNEENGCPLPDFNKIMINVTKELSDTHHKNPQRISPSLIFWKTALRNSWRRY